MTKQILLLIFILLSAACKTSVEETNQEKSNTTSSKTNHQTTAPATQQLSSNELNTSFPFDIKLKDADGKIHNSADIFKLNGKPTVLMFWLTTCGPCHQKLNAITPLYTEWAKEADFNIYAISGDFPKNYGKFVEHTKAKNWPWETYNDVTRSFRDVLPGKLNGYPQTFIFDEAGKLVYQDKKYRRGDEVRLFDTIKEICNS